MGVKMNEFELCIMANCPLLYVVSPEENRFIKEIENICIKNRRKLWIHSISTGLYNIAFSKINELWQEKKMGRIQDDLKDPIALLEQIKKREKEIRYKYKYRTSTLGVPTPYGKFCHQNPRHKQRSMAD